MTPYKKFHFEPTRPGLNISPEQQRVVQKNAAKQAARNNKRRTAEKRIKERTKELFK